MESLRSLTEPSPSTLLAGRASRSHHGRGLALLALAAALSLALLAGLSATAGTAHASFPGSNGRIACSGPLGPIPPPAGGSFLEIFSINPDATGQTRLTNNTNSDFNPRYSADGTKITFVRDNNVWTMNADGSNQTQLTTGNTDSFVGGWSPDGSQIVFQSSRDGNFEVYKINADGTGLTNVTNNPGSATVGNSDSQPSWSPDGTKIAFQSNRRGNPDIWVMNANGTGARPLTSSSHAEESAPEWSPDGEQIAFQSDRGFVPRPGVGRNLEIYRMRAADGSNVVRLTFNDYNPNASGGETTANLSGFDLNPHWSPEGDRIVFHSGRNIRFGAAQWDAFTINSDTGENPAFGQTAFQLTDRDFNDERCGWGVATAFHVLSVTKAGSGEGTVTSSPGGIDCGSDCAQGYAPGTTVTLTAAPASSGSTFEGFTGGGCSGTATTCTVTVDQAKTVTAIFSDPSPALTVTKAGSGETKAGTGEGTVTSEPAGISCGADCTEEYPVGQQVTLTASPAAGSTFSGFSGGGCSGTATTCTVTMDQAKTVTATFGGPLLTVTKAGDGQGTVTSNPLGISCGTDCSEDYAPSTTVTLTATVSTSTVAGGPGSSFGGFSGGGCSGTATTCTVTMDQAKTVTATFIDYPTLTVTKAGAGAGTVTSSPAGLNCGATCSRDFPKDSSVTLTASPAAGSAFGGFSGGGCSGTATTCTVTMDQAKTVTATFVPGHLLSVTKAGAGSGTVTSSPAGINCGADCSESYAVGTEVTLTATPAAGDNAFAGFSGGGCSGSGSTCTVTMDQARTVTATFVVTHALSVTKEGAGSGTVTSAPAGIDCGADCLESYASGTEVTLAASPASGSSFAGFTGAGCSGSGTTCVVTMDQARSVTATFALVPRALSVTKAGNGDGTVTSSPAGIDCGPDCVQDYDHGTEVTLTASPASGSTFAGFTGGGCSGTGTTCVVTMDQSRSVTAEFRLIPAAAPPPDSGCPGGSSPGVTCEVTGGQRIITGTADSDTIIATAGRDVIRSGGGDDVVRAGAGNDDVRGGAGNDRIDAGLGDDVVDGESGNDTISGGPGNDVLLGGSGNDILGGGTGNDRSSGGEGADVLSGNEGNDAIRGGNESDKIHGNEGNDRVSGGAGQDRLSGGSGADRLSGGSGSDRIRGDSGSDRLRGGSGLDRLAGGNGSDLLNGGSGRDRLVGGPGRDRLIGGPGRDTSIQ